MFREKVSMLVLVNYLSQKGNHFALLAWNVAALFDSEFPQVVTVLPLPLANFLYQNTLSIRISGNVHLMDLA